MKISFLRASFILISVLFLMRGVSLAQSAQAAGENPPIEQPLVREGEFALTLAEALGLGETEDETKAMNILLAAGIAPENGWVADYPVTPDVVGELQESIGEAADAGKLSLGKDAALIVYRDVIEEYGLSIRVGDGQGATGWGVDPSTDELNDYYETTGPPVVTYYAPPPAYAYMYTWVPYPFWWWNYWYPGYFVLVDFDIRIHFHDRVRYRPHDRFRPHFHERRRPVPHERFRPGDRARHDLRGRRPGEFISNRYFDRKTERVRRIDPTKRTRTEFRVNTFGEFGGRGDAGGTRGFRPTRPRGGTHSSAFDRSGTSRLEGAASDRGFRSRDRAGIIPRRAAPVRDRTIQDRSVPPRAERDRAPQGAVRADQAGKPDVRREGFRDRRGGTFHGGGQRQRR